MTSLEPVRADHRFLQKLLGITLAGKVESTPDELDRISRVFIRLGGSWYRLFRGSTCDVDLIKKVVKNAYKAGLLTKKRSK